MIYAMQTVDATTTMVADVTMDVAITEVETESLPAFGSSYFSSSAVDAEMDLDAVEMDVGTIAVFGSFCSLSSVAAIHLEDAAVAAN